MEKISNIGNLIKKESYDGSEAYADFQIGDSGFNPTRDVKITFYHFPLIGSKEKIFKYGLILILF